MGQRNRMAAVVALGALALGVCGPYTWPASAESGREPIVAVVGSDAVRLEVGASPVIEADRRLNAAQGGIVVRSANGGATIRRTE
ncbi:hypothetical protein [Allokutzneria oryzae]|uniref:Uncharacterized protein n=1 Tax=Allokutzneria oryzae TaxID=1378989 RepID=A0ABV6A278_9PSEU